MNISARDILMVDTISKGNDKPWDKLIAYMEAECPKGEPVEFDFRGIEVIQPCNSNSFLKLLSNPDFCMTMYNNENTVNSIRLMCTLNNYDTSRIKNVNDIIPKTMSSEEKTIERMASQLMPYFETSDTGIQGTLNVHNRFDQIGQPNTVKYIEAAIKKYSEDTGVKDIKVYTKMMSIQPSVVETITDMIEQMHRDRIEVTFMSDDKDIQDKIDMRLDLGKANYSSSEKYNIMKSRLTMNRVGLLIKYKEGRGKDEFGRQGKGEKVMVRIALFKGFTKRDNTILACFRSFNGNTFYTKSHWYLEHDCEELSSLNYDDILIPIDELGLYNDFLGSKYHFSNPIQYSKGGETIMYSTNENGSVVGTSMTIPERAKAVFDDFGIEYDHESLDKYIEETLNIVDGKM